MKKTFNQTLVLLLILSLGLINSKSLAQTTFPSTGNSTTSNKSNNSITILVQGDKNDTYIGKRNKQKAFYANCNRNIVSQVYQEVSNKYGYPYYKLTNGEAWEVFDFKDGKIFVSQQESFSYKNYSPYQLVKIYPEKGFCKIFFVNKNIEQYVFRRQ